MSAYLLTIGDSQPKAKKGQAVGYLTAVLHLAPHTLAGRGNVCHFASPECRAACLNTAGRGGIGAGSDDDIRARRTNAIQRARIARTERFFDHSALFLDDLAREIARHVARAERLGMVPAIRLNGTSDIQWEKVAPGLFGEFSHVQFYDYTKYPFHRRPTSALPSNYHLTMSYSGHNADACLDALANGRNVATVFAVAKGAPLPSMFGAHRVIDGDETDLRFLDPSPVIVGLRAKGRARKDTESPFIVRAPFTAVQED